MSVVGAIVKLAVSLLALEAMQRFRAWRTAPHRVPQSKPPVARRPLKVVQGGRR